VVHVAVRRVRPSDAAALKEIRLAALLEAPFAFGSTHAAEVSSTDERWLHRATLGSSGSDSANFLAWTDVGPVGLVGGYRREPSTDDVELVSMWAAPEARRSGVGQLLVKAVIEWAVETDATSIGLWVTGANEPAQRLYESMGFDVTGEHQPLPSDPCKDEVRMRLGLARR
jgi:ribosomal protein S18 acetylase RimI-like enzyme